MVDAKPKNVGRHVRLTTVIKSGESDVISYEGEIVSEVNSSVISECDYILRAARLLHRLRDTTKLAYLYGLTKDSTSSSSTRWAPRRGWLEVQEQFGRCGRIPFQNLATYLQIGCASPPEPRYTLTELKRYMSGAMKCLEHAYPDGFPQSDPLYLIHAEMRELDLPSDTSFTREVPLRYVFHLPGFSQFRESRTERSIITFTEPIQLFAVEIVEGLADAFREGCSTEYSEEHSPRKIPRLTNTTNEIPTRIGVERQDSGLRIQCNVTGTGSVAPSEDPQASMASNMESSIRIQLAYSSSDGGFLRRQKKQELALQFHTERRESEWIVVGAGSVSECLLVSRKFQKSIARELFLNPCTSMVFGNGEPMQCLGCNQTAQLDHFHEECLSRIATSFFRGGLYMETREEVLISEDEDWLRVGLGRLYYRVQRTGIGYGISALFYCGKNKKGQPSPCPAQFRISHNRKTGNLVREVLSNFTQCKEGGWRVLPVSHSCTTSANQQPPPYIQFLPLSDYLLRHERLPGWIFHFNIPVFVSRGVLADTCRIILASTGHTFDLVYNTERNRLRYRCTARPPHSSKRVENDDGEGDEDGKNMIGEEEMKELYDDNCRCKASIELLRDWSGNFAWSSPTAHTLSNCKVRGESVWMIMFQDYLYYYHGEYKVLGLHGQVQTQKSYIIIETERGTGVRLDYLDGTNKYTKYGCKNSKCAVCVSLTLETGLWSQLLERIVDGQDFICHTHSQDCIRLEGRTLEEAKTGLIFVDLTGQKAGLTAYTADAEEEYSIHDLEEARRKHQQDQVRLKSEVVQFQQQQRRARNIIEDEEDEEDQAPVDDDLEDLDAHVDDEDHDEQLDDDPCSSVLQGMVERWARTAGRRSRSDIEARTPSPLTPTAYEVEVRGGERKLISAADAVAAVREFCAVPAGEPYEPYLEVFARFCSRIYFPWETSIVGKEIGPIPGLEYLITLDPDPDCSTILFRTQPSAPRLQRICSDYNCANVCRGYELTCQLHSENRSRIALVIADLASCPITVIASHFSYSSLPVREELSDRTALLLANQFSSNWMDHVKRQRASGQRIQPKIVLKMVITLGPSQPCPPWFTAHFLAISIALHLRASFDPLNFTYLRKRTSIVIEPTLLELLSPNGFDFLLFASEAQYLSSPVPGEPTPVPGTFTRVMQEAPVDVHRRRNHGRPHNLPATSRTIAARLCNGTCSTEYFLSSLCVYRLKGVRNGALESWYIGKNLSPTKESVAAECHRKPMTDETSFGAHVRRTGHKYLHSMKTDKGVDMVKRERQDIERGESAAQLLRILMDAAGLLCLINTTLETPWPFAFEDIKDMQTIAAAAQGVLFKARISCSGKDLLTIPKELEPPHAALYEVSRVRPPHETRTQN